MIIANEEKKIKTAPKAKVFFPNLDGLRFLAFFAVFLAHSFYSENETVISTTTHQLVKEINIFGIYGVNFFFVLSGFLITYLLIAEEKNFGKIHIPSFYVRRILRIWPLYYAIVFVGFVLFPIGKQLIGESLELEGSVWPYIFFINNYFKAPETAILGVLWSIAIEEQFYLFWPLLIGTVFKNSRMFLFFLVITVSFLWRLSGNGGYADTISCISDMAVGGLGAYLAFHKYPVVQKLEKIPKRWILAFYILGFAIFFSKGFWSVTEYVRALQRLIFSLFFLFVILEQNYASHSVFKMSNFPFLTKWGKYTYGLYMLHFPVIYLTGKIVRAIVGDHSLFHVLITETMAALLVSMVASYISFHFYEKHFLKVKEKFSFIKK